MKLLTKTIMGALAIASGAAFAQGDTANGPTLFTNVDIFVSAS